MTDFKDIAELALAIMLPLGGGFAGGILTGNQIKTWYAKLKKPSWNPPNWLFGPVWTVLYICMGVASWLVYKQGGFEQQAVPLTLYGVQLVLNLAWTPIFFGLHRLGLALLDILVLDGLVIATIVHFARVIGVGAALGLLLPYLLWSSFATLLTYTIWRLNAKHGSEAEQLLGE